MTGFTPTPEQKAVIAHPMVPLRVAAGAGTGKTTTLAHRVAAAVDVHGVAPDRVLGLTFTNKAAHELAERFRDVLGDRLETGESVEVSTYHGFASAILADHGARIGIERDSRLVTPTFARQMLLDAVTVTPVTATDLTAHRKIVSDLNKLASDLGDNLLTPMSLLENLGGGSLAADATEVIALKDWRRSTLRKAATAGEPSRDPNRERIEPVDDDADPISTRRREYAQTLFAYEARKRHYDALDYADLIRMAHHVVTAHPDVATTIRDRYDLVLLDEYQDTNVAQRLLIQAVFGDGFPVTAVGDRDQTIYEWRGASLDNFARFPDHFPERSSERRDRPAVTLGLTLNRRSGAHILQVANRVRENISGAEAEPLRPLEGTQPGTVTVAWFRTARDEAEAIAERLHQLHVEDGVAWKDMAVLFRKNKDIALIRDALEDNGIPIQVANLGGLLTIPEVVEIHAWLRALANPEDTPALARILMGSQHRLGMADMRRLADWVRAQDTDTPDDEDHLPRHTLIEALEHTAAGGDEIALSLDGRQTVDVFLSRFRRLLTAAQGTSLVELVQQILAETAAWRDVEAMPATAQLSARLNLYRFLDLAESWSPLEGRPSLNAFVAYLDLMADEDIEELDTARIAGDDAVTLVTIHRAKGLEWDVVCIPACQRNNFPSSVRLYEDPFRQAAILPYELRLDRHDRPQLSADMDEKARRAVLKERHDDQEWRLAYVATTRARRWLWLSGAAWTGSVAPNKTTSRPSQLLDQVRDLDFVSTLTWIEDPGERPEQLRYEDLANSPDPLFEAGWDAALRAFIAQPDAIKEMAADLDLEAAYDADVSAYQDMLFSLPDPPNDGDHGGPSPLKASVTSLVTYATCPKRYFWSEVDRLPRRASSAARRGVELHRRIEMHHRGVVPIDDLDPELYDMVPAESDGTEATGTAFERFMASRFADPRPAFIEAPFELHLDGRALLRGRVDAIYAHTSDHWEIVDFKSGRPSRHPARTVQLQAYAIAAREAGFAPSSPTRLDVTFAYFGGGTAEEVTHVDDDWLGQARHDLTGIIDSIHDEAFEPTPSAACTNCDFLRFCDAGQTWDRDHQTGSPG